METLTKTKNIPVLRFPEFSKEWTKTKLKNISSVITKGTTPKKFTKQGINFIKIECLVGKYINENKCLSIDHETHKKELKRSILKENDILFAIAGATIGKIAIVTKDILPANTNQALSIIRLENLEYIQFVLHIMQSNVMQRYIQQCVSVGAQPNLNLQQMGDFSFLLPSLPEQTKIANFLTVVDDKIGQLSKKKDLLEQYKKGMMQKIFSQEIRFKDDDGNDFEDWEQKKLGEVLIEQKEKTTENNRYSVLSSTKDGIYLQSDYFDRQIASKDNIGYKVLKKNQLVFSPQNLWLGNININLSIEIGMVSPSYKIFDFSNNINIVFIKDFIKTPKMLYEYSQASEQGASVVRRNLDMSSFLNIKIYIPLNDEQTKIANFLSAIDKKIELANVELEKVKEFKKGLLQQMFV